jgi:hypothetical protein
LAGKGRELQRFENFVSSAYFTGIPAAEETFSQFHGKH